MNTQHDDVNDCNNNIEKYEFTGTYREVTKARKMFGIFFIKNVKNKYAKIKRARE